MSNTTLVTREQEHQTATSLYGDNADLAELFENIRKVAPWANDRQHAMDNAEIGYVIRRSVAMGLDPLNPHEVQVWKDGKGVHFQLSYTLLMEWVRHFYGEHTEPKYRRLSAEELEEQGMQERDVAYEVTFLMKKDIPSLTELVSAGYDAREAREMLEIRGTGAATASEWSSQYFAANGRTKAWKVQKRALTDAIRRKFGTPTRVEIEEIRRAGGLQEIGELEHYEGIPDNIDARGRAALIKTRAHQREHQERLETDPEYKAEFEETARAGVDAMFGEGTYDATQPDPDPEPDVVEADYRDAPDPEPVEPQPEPPAAQTDTTPVRPYDPWTLHALIEQSIEKRRAKGDTLGPRLENFKKAVISNLESCFTQHQDQARHAVTDYLLGKGSSKDWDDFETQALHGWLGATEQDGVWIVNEHAKTEAHAAYKEAMATQGQQTLDL